MVLAAEILRGRRIGIRIEPATLMFLDLQTREPLRTRPNTFTPEQVRALRGPRWAGPPPRPRTEPVTVQRRASNTGVVMVAGPKISLGRLHAGQVITTHVADTTLSIELGGDDVRDGPADQHPARPQYQSPPAPQGHPVKPRTSVKHVLGLERQASRGTRHRLLLLLAGVQGARASLGASSRRITGPESELGEEVV
ncbi:hypothetical protein [Actinomadura montaniterrae]|uniref:Uncharacterized protein n=1 Tax=Actinomadura montaniterrae TaxID=1803903 RepID=A0A6L3W1Q1_9ACTN|nr:hypothetical protein [Actinomadura montaniterrae]KAB2388826.1 hypothetical protein F9B16_02615 [Actinomadura montaniterrae]